MRQLFFISGICVLVWTMSQACQTPSDMKQIEQLWTQLIQSQNTQAEASNVQKIQLWIAQQNGYIEISVIDKQGNTLRFDEVEISPDQLTSTHILFSWREEEFLGKHWIPKDWENVEGFLLE